MRVVVPYTHLHPETSRLLADHLPDHHLAPLNPNDPTAYARLLAAEWARPGDLVTVEHDIGVHKDVLPGFTACPHLWCGYAYNIAGRLLACLGCTRFRAELKTAEPDVFAAANRIDTDGLPAMDWRRLDVRLDGELRARGYTLHVHEPPVAHYHHYPEQVT
jgi:hypothetical protein